MTKFNIENSSFRDKSGFLFYQNNILYRLIDISYKEHYDHLINSELYNKLSEKNLLITHEEINDLKLDHDYYKIIKPEKIPIALDPPPTQAHTTSGVVPKICSVCLLASVPIIS